ncbi:MAG: hypothetical protein Tsb0010_13870 [Parvularculaceae bacterium]
MKTLCAAIAICLAAPVAALAQREPSPYDTASVMSEDGQWIYFYSYRHGAAELYRMAPDGSGQTRLTHTDYNEWWPFITPDPNILLVASDKDSQGAFRGANLYLFDIRSGEMENLTHLEPGQWAARAAVAAEDNLALVAMSVGFGADAHNELWFYDLESRARWLYLDNPAHNNRFPSISRDGETIAYISERNGRRGVYLNDSSGQNERLLMETTGEAFGALSPDGDWFAFSMGATANALLGDTPSTAERDIYLLRTNGSELRRLTAAPGSDHGAAWSPDSKTVFFSSYRCGPADIYAIEIDGSHERNLSQTSHCAE